MPIQPPKLDDRTYADLVREARALIPQYCPEWTHLGDADPGMTLVQLFAWMTEMTLYRLNRVPDKTYIHFLNFIGEERRTAQAARVPVTFSLRPDAAPGEVPAGTRVSTRQRAGGEALHFLTAEPLTVHGAQVRRMMAVAAGPQPLVRELSFERMPNAPQALQFGQGEGVAVFRMDALDDGVHSYTADQYVYVRHEDFRRMQGGPADPGALRIRSVGDPGLPVAALFEWAFPVAADDGVSWVPMALDEARSTELLGLPDEALAASLPKLAPLPHLGHDADPIALPDDVDPHGWIRGRVTYERWLAHLMEEELRVTWRDDRGGDEREIASWRVRDVGRTLEFHLQNVPPIRAGWALRFTLVDHGLPAGHEGYLPRYRWSYRRGDRWLAIDDAHVQRQGASVVITGPLADMAADGFNLRAERAEAVSLEGLLPGLEADLVWRRPIGLHLAEGPDADAAMPHDVASLPRSPFQPAPTVPALLGMKWFVGSDVLANRLRTPVLLEMELGFEREGELVEEPVEDYHLQLCYRTAHGWQVVHHERVDLSRFTFGQLDPDGAKQPIRRLVRLVLDPVAHLDGLVRASVGGTETAWLRLELTRAALTWQADKKTAPVPVSLRVFDVRMGLEGALGATTWDEPLPGARVLAVEHRGHNRRLTRCLSRREGEVVADHPFDDVVEVADDDGGHHALYLQLDRPLPAGQRLATMFRCRGQTYLPAEVSVQWELLQGAPRGGRRWRRLHDEGDGAYDLSRTGVLAFGLDAPGTPAKEGVWLRGVFRHAGGTGAPPMPPLTHVLPNTLEAVNLHGFRQERFSGEGVPHQVLQLRHFPIHLPPEDAVAPVRGEIELWVEEEDGERRRWRVAPGNRFSTCTKDDRVFVVDTVEGTLSFGNGVRGRILPVGSFNITVASYHTVPGAAGNVAAGEVVVPEGHGDWVSITNVIAASGGRNAESIDEILRRAPNILTSRDRAVTRGDFEAIAQEASAEVARAAVMGGVGDDGTVDVVILPRRRTGEVLPDAYLAAGLREHVQRYLAVRALVNVLPQVRLATFQTVDVSVRVRLRPHAHRVQVRESVTGWIRAFLDPYRGGLEGQGWPFGATLYAQDFGRLVQAVPEVRHVVDVRIHPVDATQGATAAWTSSQGVDVLNLSDADLVHVRLVRVQWAEDAR